MSEPSFGRGAVETIGRGVQAAPALRRGIGVTLLLALIGAAGRVVIPVLVQQAIDKDPTNPLPYAGLALGYALIGHEAMPDAFTRARSFGFRPMPRSPA